MPIERPTYIILLDESQMRSNYTKDGASPLNSYSSHHANSASRLTKNWSITGTNLQMIAENPADDLHRYAKIAIQPQFTNDLGHVVAYFHSRKSSLAIDGITTHEIGIDGILVVEAKGFKKKLINLKDYYKASRVSYRNGLCLACFVELDPIPLAEK